MKHVRISKYPLLSFKFPDLQIQNSVTIQSYNVASYIMPSWLYGLRLYALDVWIDPIDAFGLGFILCRALRRLRLNYEFRVCAATARPVYTEYLDLLINS